MKNMKFVNCIKLKIKKRILLIIYNLFYEIISYNLSLKIKILFNKTIVNLSKNQSIFN